MASSELDELNIMWRFIAQEIKYSNFIQSLDFLYIYTYYAFDAFSQFDITHTKLKSFSVQMQERILKTDLMVKHTVCRGGYFWLPNRE
jgi:hypothetical protein